MKGTETKVQQSRGSIIIVERLQASLGSHAALGFFLWWQSHLALT